MSHPLEGVRLKVIRAAEHLQTLDEENRAYFEGKPYEVVHERDEERSRHVYRFHVRQPPPLRLSILVGDCFHNIRSSLDHLAWQLVLADGGTPTKRVFPSSRTKEVFESSRGAEGFLRELWVGFARRRRHSSRLCSRITEPMARQRNIPCGFSTISTT